MISNCSSPTPFTCITLNTSLLPLFTPAISQVALTAIPGFVRKGSLSIDTDTIDITISKRSIPVSRSLSPLDNDTAGVLVGELGRQCSVQLRKVFVSSRCCSEPNYWGPARCRAEHLSSTMHTISMEFINCSPQDHTAFHISLTRSWTGGQEVSDNSFVLRKC